MTDALGYRKKFGVIIPSTNTIVEPDFHRIERVGRDAAHVAHSHPRPELE